MYLSYRVNTCGRLVVPEDLAGQDPLLSPGRRTPEGIRTTSHAVLTPRAPSDPSGHLPHFVVEEKTRPRLREVDGFLP
jgi:hypothetical protein